MLTPIRGYVISPRNKLSLIHVVCLGARRRVLSTHAFGASTLLPDAEQRGGCVCAADTSRGTCANVRMSAYRPWTNPRICAYPRVNFDNHLISPRDARTRESRMPEYARTCRIANISSRICRGCRVFPRIRAVSACGLALGHVSHKKAREFGHVAIKRLGH